MPTRRRLTSAFHVGERVRVIGNTCYHSLGIGSEIVLGEECDSGWSYGTEGWFITSNDIDHIVSVESAEPTPIAFKIGDKVRVDRRMYKCDRDGIPERLIVHGMAEAGEQIGTIVDKYKDFWIVKFNRPRTEQFGFLEKDMKPLVYHFKRNDIVSLKDIKAYDIGVIKKSQFRITTLNRGGSYPVLLVKIDDNQTYGGHTDNFILVKEYIPDKKAKIVKPYILDKKIKISRRMFGIELETIHNGIDEREIQNMCMSSPSTTYVDFKSDSSIDCDENYEDSIEVITNPLTSRKGLERIANLCKILTDREMATNRSCGYHVHLSTGSIFGNIQKMKTTILFYWLFEEVFFSFLPRSRSENSYCRKLQSIYNDLPHFLKNITTLKEFEMMWYKEGSHYYAERRKKDHYDNTRYCWVNFHCLLAPSRNLEIRSHNGTLDPHKVINWIRLHDHILSAIRDNKVSVKSLLAFQDFVLSGRGVSSTESFTNAMFNMIALPEDLKTYYLARQALFATQKPKQSIEEIDEPEEVISYDNNMDYSQSDINSYLPINQSGI